MYSHFVTRALDVVAEGKRPPLDSPHFSGSPATPSESPMNFHRKKQRYLLED